MEKLTNAKIIEHIKTMTALELKQLVSAIEEEFGVTAAAVAVAGPAVAADAGQEEKQATSIYLKEIGAAPKVAVIKLIKEKLGKDLMSAKKLTDAVAEGPQLLKDNASPAELKDLEEAFKALGVIVEIK
ncbi:MAG: ribosomal protein L7/L12 [Spiroplasma sp.]|nr:ribosomal protein L7/L12 [Spiroplasma sp.]